MRHALKVPEVGESIREVQIGAWRKRPGEPARKDEPLVEIESDKATVDIAAPAGGVLAEVLKEQGETAAVGEVIGYFDDAPSAAAPTASAPAATAGSDPPSVAASAPSATPPIATESPATAVSAVAAAQAAHARPSAEPQTDRPPRVMPAAQAALAERGLRPEDVEASGPGGRLLKEDVLRRPETPAAEPSPDAAAGAGEVSAVAGDREERLVPMSPLRKRIAQRLVEAQQHAALLTTFNEIDMSAVVALRQKHRDAFQQRYNVKLGFMSFFVKAVVHALRQCPELNAEIRGSDIAYRDYYDIGIAVGGGKGLVVPVLRDAEGLGFAEIERAIADFAARAQAGRLKPSELERGTFTISNGGVYGSLLSTPIVNPPQSGILGLHAIQDRPVARDGQVVIRPMMYVALTYDHRIVDGREAVGFLKQVKETMEDPARLLLEV